MPGRRPGGVPNVPARGRTAHRSPPPPCAQFPASGQTRPRVRRATVTDGSCTAAFLYWSSTTAAFFSGSAWVVDFGGGFVIDFDKGDARPVRAVRGGSP
ncbi:MAG: DUF1566 domain-containing protein [Pseudomonadota bacterium]|nr:DUF1566 domain-containing protein [Pseudomonadota bacterium]